MNNVLNDKIPQLHLTKAQSKALSQSVSNAVYSKVSPEDAKLITNSKDAYILLDVRTIPEYSGGHISGAVLIPDYELAERAETELPDKNTLILVYCHSGRRSANAANALINMGYTNVLDLGGIINWPYETVKVTTTGSERLP